MAKPIPHDVNPRQLRPTPRPVDAAGKVTRTCKDCESNFKTERRSGRYPSRCADCHKKVYGNGKNRLPRKGTGTKGARKPAARKKAVPRKTAGKKKATPRRRSTKAAVKGAIRKALGKGKGRKKSTAGRKRSR